MKNTIKIGINCLAGIVIPIVVFAVMAAASYISLEVEGALEVAYIVILPVSLFSGGWLTGYLNADYIKNTIISYLTINPGLYIAFIILVGNIFLGSIEHLVSILGLSAIIMAITLIGVVRGIKKKARSKTTK